MGKASTLVDLLANAGVEPSPELFDEMCREREIHPAFSAAYAARGLDGIEIRDVAARAFRMIQDELAKAA